MFIPLPAACLGEVNPVHAEVPCPQKTHKTSSWNFACADLPHPFPLARGRDALWEGVGTIPNFSVGSRDTEWSGEKRWSRIEDVLVALHQRGFGTEMQGGKELVLCLNLSMKRVGHLTLSFCTFQDPGNGKTCSESSCCAASVSMWDKIFLQLFLYYKFI